MRKEAVRVSMIDLNFVKKFLTDMQSKLLEHKDNGPVEFISESEYCGPFAKKIIELTTSYLQSGHHEVRPFYSFTLPSH